MITSVVGDVELPCLDSKMWELCLFDAVVIALRPPNIGHIR
jgi:hypothetical protein